MAKIIGDVFDARLLKYSWSCLVQASRQAKSSRLSLTREGYPKLTFPARGEEAYYKVFDKFESCLNKKKPRGRHPCTGVKGKKARDACREKMRAIRETELAKLKKKYSGVKRGSW